MERYLRLCQDVARLTASGNVIDWFQGRMEWDPRARGNRSIIGDARSVEMQKNESQDQLQGKFPPIRPICNVRKGT